MFGSLNPCQWFRFTNAAAGLVKKATGLCTITGLLCTESSSFVINIWDGQDASGTLGPTKKIVGPLTLVAGNPYPIPAKCNNGIFIDVVSGTGDATLFYD